MKNILLTAALLVWTIVAAAQKKPLRKQRLIISHGIGYNFPLNTVKVNPLTDQLTDINDKGVSLQMFSIGVYMKHNIGFELLLQGMPDTKSEDRTNRFVALVEERWADQYYINSLGPYNNSGISQFAGALGINYKIEKNRFTFIPKIFVGILSIDQASAIYYLKEKNANTVLKLNYSSDKSTQDKFMMGPAISAVYRFNSIIGFGLNASLFRYKANMVYEEKLTNLVTNESSSSYHHYTQTMHRMYIGLNMSMGFGKR